VHIGLNTFPLLYDRFVESTESNLVVMYIYHSVYIYNKQGEYLNFVRHPNLYDYGRIGVTFLNETYLTIDDNDENNGSYTELFKHERGRFTRTDCFSVDLLKLMESKGCEWGINNLSEDIRDNKNAILLAFSNKWSTNLRRYDLSYVSQRLRDDDDVAELAIDCWSDNYLLLSDRLKCKELLALNYIKNCPENFQRISETLKSNKNFVLAAVDAKPEVIDHLQDTFQTDPEIVMLAMQSYPGAYVYYLSLAPPEFFHNKSNIIDIVSKYPMAIRYLSDELRNDREIAACAIRKKAEAAEFVPALKTDRDFSLQMTAINGSVIRYLESFGKDEYFALECVRHNGLNLQYFNDTIRRDKHIVLEAYKQNKDSFSFAADALRRDDEIGELINQQMAKKPKDDDLPF
jgi:hypothetical protein